jgi:hypothetical protein
MPPSGAGGAPKAAAPTPVPPVRSGGTVDGSRGPGNWSGAGGLAASPRVRATMPPTASPTKINSAGSITA